MRRLRARLEHAAEVEREITAHSRETIVALERRIHALEEIVRSRDIALRDSEQTRLATLEESKRLRVERDERVGELEISERRARHLEEALDSLAEKSRELDRTRETMAELRLELRESVRARGELERQVDLYRETARCAESRQLAAELAAAKSESAVKRFIATPVGEDRLALERRIGALQEKLRELESRAGKDGIRRA